MNGTSQLLNDIFDLIPVNPRSAADALEKFKTKEKFKGPAFLHAKSELLSKMIAMELDPYAKLEMNMHKLLAVFTKAKKYDEAAWTMLTTADHYFYHGNLIEGEKCLNYVKDNLLDKISLAPESAYLFLAAHVCNVKREYAQRTFIAMQGFEKLKQAENKDGRWYGNYTVFCIVIADSYFRNGQFEDAWAYLQEALAIDASQKLSSRFRLDIYHNVATYYSIKEDNANCIIWCEKAIALLKNENENHPNLAGQYYLISYCYFLFYAQIPERQKKARKDILTKMEACLDHCEKIVATFKSPIHLAHWQSSKSRLELLKKNYAEAMRLLDASIPVHRQFDHLVGISEYYHIGNKVLYEWGLQTNDKKKLIRAFDLLQRFTQIVRDNAAKATLVKLNTVRDTYELKQKKLTEQLMKQQLDALNKEIQLVTLSLHDKILVLDEVRTYVQSLKRKELEMRELSKAIVKKIDSVKMTEQDKNRLQQKLATTNRLFEKILIEKYPALTNLEVNMCNLFRAGLTDKELAKLYGQSYKSYEQHRFRIKRKMKLNREVSLVKYLMQLGAEL